MSSHNKKSVKHILVVMLLFVVAMLATTCISYGEVEFDNDNGKYISYHVYKNGNGTKTVTYKVTPDFTGGYWCAGGYYHSKVESVTVTASDGSNPKLRIYKRAKYFEGILDNVKKGKTYTFSVKLGKKEKKTSEVWLTFQKDTCAMYEYDSHKLKYIEKKKATTTSDGWQAYYVCTRENCKVPFSDAEGTKPIRNIITYPKIKSISLLTNEYNYTGKACKPTPRVLNSKGKRLVQGTDYTITYSNNVKPGTASAVIKFKGNYSGSVTKTFKIKGFASPLTNGMTKLNLFPKYNGTIEKGKPIVKVFPGSFKMDFPAADIKVNNELQDNGTYKLKMTLGITDNDIVKKEDKWKRYVLDIKEAKKSGNLSALKNKYNVSLKKYKMTSKFNVNTKVMGYYEAVYDSKGKIISESGSAGIEVNLDAKYSQQCITAPIPIPYYVTIGGKIDAKGKIGLKIKTDASPNLTGSIELKPEVYAKLGLGSEDFGGHVKGSGGLDIKILPKGKGDFIAGFYAGYKLGTFYEKEYTIAEAKYPLWPKKSSASLKTLSKDFANIKQLSSTTGSIDDPGVTITDITTAENSTVSPVMFEIDGIKTILYQEIDSDGKSVLKYSSFDGGIWTDPKAVSEVAGSVYSIDVKTVGNEVYLAYNELQDEESGIVRIYRFNSTDKKFEAFITAEGEVTSENVTGKPVIVDCNGKPAFVWVETVTQENTRSNSIIVTRTEEDTWEKNLLGETSIAGSISEMIAIYNDENFVAFSTSIPDQDSMTEILNRTDSTGNTVVQKFTESYIMNLSITENKVSYVQDGILHKIDTAGGPDEEIAAGETETVAGDTQNISEESKDALIWAEDSEGGSVLRSSVKCSDGTYSNPVTVCKFEGRTLDGFSALADEDGNWNIACITRPIAYGENGIDNEATAAITGTVSYITKIIAPKLTIDDAIINESEETDGVQPMQFAVTNEGEKPVKSFTMTVSDEEGDIKTEEIACNINPGETAYFDNQTISTEKLAGYTKTIEIETVAENQIDMSETSDTETVNYSDISTTNDKEVEGETVNIIATVENEGTSDCKGGRLSLVAMSGEELGEEVASQTFEAIPAGENCQNVLTASLDDLNFTKEGTAHFAVKATPRDIEERDIENNISYGVIYACELPENYNIAKKSLNGVKDYTYNGKIQKNSPVISDLKNGTDFILSYSNASSKNVGEYTVTVTGAGKYFNVKSASYKINPKGTIISKLVPAQKTITARWKKQSARMSTKRITGYQIQYAQNAKFTKGTKIIKVKGYTKTSKKLTKLNSKRKYYVRIRTYSVVNGKNFYSTWSKTKSIKTR